MAREYRTGIIITGDASGGIRAIRATDDQLGRLNRGFERGSQRSRNFQRDVASTSSELTVLRRAAAPLAATLAGMFAVSTLKSQIDFADQLQKTNSRIGASTEALSEYRLVAKLSGVEFGQLATAWQRQTRRIAQAAQGTGEAQAALESLNLSARDLAKMAPEDQFERIATAMRGVASEAEKVALAQKVWDSEGVKLLQIVNQSSDAIESMRQQARDLGLSISGETASAMAGFNDQMDMLSFAAQGASQTMLTELVPSLTSGLQSLNAFVANAGGAEEVLSDLAAVGGTLASVYGGRMVGALAGSAAAMVANTRASIADTRAEASAAQAVTRRTGAEVASAKAMLSTARLEAAATKGTAAHTFALSQLSAARVRATTAAGAHTNATNVAAAAMGRASVAARGLSGALALAGGPLGLLVGAAGLLYVFRDELRLTGERLGLTEDEASDFQDELDDLSNKDMSHSLDSLNSALDQATLKAAAAREEVARLKKEDDGYSVTGIGNLGDQVAGYNALGDAKRKLAKIEQKRNMSRIELWGRWSSEVNESSSATDNNTDSTDDNNESQTQLASSLSDAEKAQAALAKSTAKQADELESLRKQLDPAYDATKKLVSQTQTLQKGLASGALGMGGYTKLLAKAAKGYISLGSEAEDATDKAGDNTDEMADLFENSMDRMDDAAVDMWRSFLDGSEGAFDSFKNLALDTLAEVIHQYTTRQITASIGGNFSVGGGQGQGAMGQQGGGFGLDNLNPGMIKKGWDTVSGYFGAGAASSGAASSGATTAGSSFSSSAMGGLYTAGAALIGSEVGDAVSGAITDKQANSNYGQMAGTAIGSIWGPIGAGIGSALGSVVDSLFGSDSSPSAAYVQEDSQINYGEWRSDLTSTGKFGFNIRDMEGDELTSLQEFGDAMAQLDAVMASTRTPEEIDSIKAAMDDFNMGTGNTLGEGVTQAFNRRLESIIDAGGYQFGELAKSASDTFGELTQNITALAGMEVKLDGFGDQVSADVRAELERVAGDDLGVAIGSMSKALDSMALMSVGAERLNLAFDATAAGAIHAASYMQDIAGGVENLAAVQQGYYQSAYSGNERLSRSQADLHETLSGVTDAVPQTVAELRGMVEAADLNTDAGAELALQLMQLAPALQQTTAAVQSAIQAQYQDALGRAPDEGGVNYWMDQVSSGALTLEQALDAIASSAEGAASGADNAAGSIADMSAAISARESLERELLKAQGDTAALRQLELDKLSDLAGAEDQGLVALQERIWALADAEDAEKKAAQAAREKSQAERAIAQERRGLESQLLQVQGDTEALRQLELASLNESNRALQERIWTIQDEMAAAEKAAQAEREAVSQSMDIIGRIQSARDNQLNAELGAIRTLSQLYDSLQLSSQSILDPLERMNEAQRQFAKLQVRAENGDTAAVGELQGASTGYLDAVAAYYGQSSEQYARVFNDVNTSVEDLSDEFESSVSELNRVGRKIDDAAAGVDANHSESLSALQGIIGGLDWLPEGIGAEIDRVISSSTASGGSGGSSSGGGSSGSGSGSGGGTSTPNTDAYNPGGSKERKIMEFLAEFDGGQITQSDTARDYWELEIGNISTSFTARGLLQAYRSSRQIINQDDFEYAGELPQFANGGAFTNGIVDQPTSFPVGVMGEAGPEAIMPLSNIGGSLGVNVAGAVDLEPLTRELHALRQEVAQLRSERRRDADQAAGQRSDQVREQRKGNRNSKLRRATV